MPTEDKRWEFRLTRKTVQTRGTKSRTVGEYQVFHNGNPAPPIEIDGRVVQLSGTTAEAAPPSQNETPATQQNPSRILARSYPLAMSDGPSYMTRGYRTDLEIKDPMPGLELRDTGNRTAILIHPGKNAFLSSIGCINLCTSLRDGNENIDYPGSRRRVIALIEDIKKFLGPLPASASEEIAHAFVTIKEASPATGSPLLSDQAPVDGRALAQQHGIDVKSDSVKISTLHPRMAAVFPAIARAARDLHLPKPVITSGNDSNHMQGSLHFKNRALDFRANNITPVQGEAFEDAVAAALGNDFDVIFETFDNPSNNHLHVEFDPD